MSLRVSSTIYDRVMANLEDAAKQFEETGFFHYSGPTYIKGETWHHRWKRHDSNYPIGPIFIRKTIRSIARELKRPIIMVETTFWGDDITTKVTLRRTKKVVPVIAQFLLLDEPNPKKPHNKQAPVTRRQDGTNWYIEFNGDEGQRLFRAWKNNTSADPECRRALMLPPLESDLKVVA